MPTEPTIISADAQAIVNALLQIDATLHELFGNIGSNASLGRAASVVALKATGAIEAVKSEMAHPTSL